MAGLCERGTEPAGSLKAIRKLRHSRGDGGDNDFDNSRVGDRHNDYNNGVDFLISYLRTLYQLRDFTAIVELAIARDFVEMISEIRHALPGIFLMRKNPTSHFGNKLFNCVDVDGCDLDVCYVSVRVGYICNWC
ncbi:hypothetical protein ANN_23246 [Periplaneta americana]|uniref:Uncharacterized protein n=1 Tax=Periplaneta americana TaxID=6978 RepID=A0ABQ8SL15_PERAM|nr:hypothetical protein ANN_23246 [Periplaneta americana]